MESSFDVVRTLYVGRDATSASEVTSQIESAFQIELTTALSVTAAIECIEAEPIDCIVAEYDLETTDGIRFREQLQDREITVPFILWTADHDPEIARRAVEVRVDRYLPKTDDSADYTALGQNIIDAVEAHAPQSAMLDRMTDAFVALDDRWQFVYLNRQGREIIGEATGELHSMNDLRGRTIWEVLPRTEDSRFQDYCEKAMETQEAVSFESFYEPLDSWFEIRAFPSPTGLSLYFYDITERRESHAELERRERILHEIYGIIADKQRTLEKKVERLLEIGREEFGMTYGSLSQIDGDDYTLDVVVGPEHDIITEGTTVQLAETNCERVVESQQRLVLANVAEEQPELTERMVYQMGVESYLGAPVFVEDDVESTFCFYDPEPRTDPFSQWELTLIDLMGSWISYERERDVQEEELERERNRLDEVASTLSHDLRNPLTTATLRLELASEECESDHLEHIDRALGRIDELIEDTLSMARLGNEVMDSEQLPFERVARQAWQTAGSTEGRLEIENDSVQIVGDESRLRQLLENIFANAIEHASQPDAQLVVTVGTLSDETGFYIADNGPGIPEDMRENVFDRGHSSTNDGTGFGLAIAQRIAEVHDGSITITDAENGGARFEVRGIELRT